MLQKYGYMDDWRNSVGTGPFMLTDFVSGASATLIRNPNYWNKDPVGPGKGNQLPYIDTVKMLIVLDVSTRMAAIRTGMADWVTGVGLDDARSLMKTTPNLQYKKYYPDSAAPVVIGMRQDKTDLPVSNKKVRQALTMAIDFNSIKNDLYGGDAEIMVWPLGPVKGYEDIHMSLEELPESVRELYSYNPTKAKQLLADAGYPKGFKTKIQVSATPQSDVDYLSVIKDMWAKIGVDVTIDVREFGVYTSIGVNFDELRLQRTPGVVTVTSFSNMRGPRLATVNPSRINDPKIQEAMLETEKCFPQDEPKARQIYRELLPYVLEQAWVIPKPTPYAYTFW